MFRVFPARSILEGTDCARVAPRSTRVMAIRIRFFLFTTFALAAIASLPAPSAIAQWKVVASFSIQVHSIYFLDQQSAPKTGFAGLANSAIFRTTNNGATWYSTSTPHVGSPMQITDFAFSDSLQGWCSVRSDFGDWGQIWKTTNGGNSWDSIYTGGAFASIAFCPTTGILIAPCWTYTTALSMMSKDSGATWTSFAPAWLNGATFSGSNGVIGNIHSPNPLYSTDGGQTWNEPLSVSFDTVETWAPHGIAGSSTFVAAGEHSKQFFISTDGGVTWTNPHTFLIPSFLTGCIQGTLTNLFVQTEGSGFYCSSDAGTSWNSICGPNNSRDTRFYSKGEEVFAGDVSGNLWYTPNATLVGASELAFDRTRIDFLGLRCATNDSTLHFTYGAGCDSATLLHAQILTGSTEFSIGSLPQTFSGRDSIDILYSPSSGLRDSGTLKLEFKLGTFLVDTIIRLYGSAQSTSDFAHVDSLVIFSSSACIANDSSIVIHNLSCDTLTITNATLTDTSNIQLFPFPLPYSIPPLDSLRISIAAASAHQGTFRSMLQLLMDGGRSVRITDSIPIALDVLHGVEALFGSLDFSVLDACYAIDTVFPISSTSCDSITLLDATLSDSSVFHLGLLQFPMRLEASGSIKLPLHIVPVSKGNATTFLHIRYVSGPATVDTSISLTVRVLYDLPLHVELTNSAFDLGNAGASCATVSQWVTIRNGLCRTLTIKRVSWVGPNSQFWFDPLSLPDTLASDTGVDSIFVHFQPDSAASISNRLRVTFEVGGKEVDTILTFFGTGVSSYSDTLLTPALGFDSLFECQSSERDGEIVNLSCDSAVVRSASIFGNSGYSIVSPVFPRTLHQGDTLRVRFLLQPTQAGAAADSAIITFHDPRNDSDYTHTIALRGYILSNLQALSLSNATFSLPSIASCSTVDSFITLSNRGTCGDIVISDTTFTGYPGITFEPPLSLPLVIHPDSSIRMGFRISPNGNATKNTALLLRGQNIDTTVSFVYASLPGSTALSMSTPDSALSTMSFLTRPCVPVSKLFWIANTGCDSLIIDTLVLKALSGSSQFTLQNIPTLPIVLAVGDTLPFAVQFDPNGNGDGLATLNVASNKAKIARSVDFTGTVVGTIPSARIALEASDGSLQCSGLANGLTSIVAMLLDDVGDSSALSTVSITLRANWNVLTPLKFSTAAGWSVVDTITLPNGDFEIRIHHDVSGPARAGTALVTCSFSITTTDSTGCNIGMTNLRFNDGTPNYEDCVLASVAIQNPVHFTALDTCGTPELRGLMTGHLALSIISIHPNPAPMEGSAAHISVMFALARAGNVRMVVRDLLGRECMNSLQSFPAGTHSVDLNWSSATEGTYFVQLESGGEVAEAKALIQGDGLHPAK